MNQAMTPGGESYQLKPSCASGCDVPYATTRSAHVHRIGIRGQAAPEPVDRVAAEFSELEEEDAVVGEGSAMSPECRG
jgi:hypothetical protein